MGVNTGLTLPAGVQLRNVGTAIALLLGKPRTWYDLKTKSHGLSQSTQSGWVEVEGVKFRSAESTPECCHIEIKGVDMWLFYHFEFGGAGRGMLGSSTAKRIALYRRLVSLFGGYVDYQDCDDTEKDYKRREAEWVGEQDDDAQFHEMQLALWNLKPITEAEIDECEQYAAYKKAAR